MFFPLARYELERFDFFIFKDLTFSRKEFCLLILELQLFFKNIQNSFCTKLSKKPAVSVNFGQFLLEVRGNSFYTCEKAE